MASNVDRSYKCTFKLTFTNWQRLYTQFSMISKIKILDKTSLKLKLRLNVEI